MCAKACGAHEVDVAVDAMIQVAEHQRVEYNRNKCTDVRFPSEGIRERMSFAASINAITDIDSVVTRCSILTGTRSDVARLLWSDLLTRPVLRPPTPPAACCPGRKPGPLVELAPACDATNMPSSYVCAHSSGFCLASSASEDS